MELRYYLIKRDKSIMLSKISFIEEGYCIMDCILINKKSCQIKKNVYFEIPTLDLIKAIEQNIFEDAVKQITELTSSILSWSKQTNHLVAKREVGECFQNTDGDTLLPLSSYSDKFIVFGKIDEVDEFNIFSSKIEITPTSILRHSSGSAITNRELMYRCQIDPELYQMIDKKAKSVLKSLNCIVEKLS